MKVKEIEAGVYNYFQNWTKNMVKYGLEAQLGQLYTNDGETALLYELGDFLFLAGVADKALLVKYKEVCQPNYRIVISEEEGWQRYLSGDSSLSSFTRYAFQDEADFDTTALLAILGKLSVDLSLEEINQAIYQELADANWSEDLQGNFADFQDFQNAGAFGFIIRKGRELVAGVSTAFAYKKAIEVEIATNPVYQKQGLASILGAKMILEALNREVFPLWDAHNEASKKIAEKLGYRYVKAYPSYEWTSYTRR